MPKNWIYILTLSFIICSCDFTTAEDYYAQAYQLEEQGKYEEAIILLDKAIEKKPNLKPALLNRGADKSALKDYKGAILDYEQILKHDPDNTLALMNIGNNYRRLEQYPKSVDFYSKALETKGAIKSDSVFAKLRLNNDEEQESDYYVQRYEIEYERGISYFALKKFDKAIVDLKEALKYDYEKPYATYWIGKAYYELNDTLNATKHLTEASEYGFTDSKAMLDKLK